ncbi:MAG: A24 family peptidase [Pseudomonadota bacterium]
MSLFSVILFVALFYASCVDIARMEIPDLVSIGLFPTGAVWLLTYSPDKIVPNLLGAIFSLLLFYLFSRAFFVLRNKEGLGFGDVKLIASSTVWVGLQNLPIMILIAATSGLIASFYNFGKKTSTQSETRIPFGPHLAIAIWIVWFAANIDLTGTGLPVLSK